MSQGSDLVDISKLEVKVLNNGVEQTRRERGLVRSIETWQRVKRLGQGGYATVYLEQCVQQPKNVRAVKELRKDGPIDYHRELEAAALFSQKKYNGVFVEFFGWYETFDRVFLTMEFLSLGDLGIYMEKKRKFVESEARAISRQVLIGLEYMHERNFIHRDLKPQNILVCEAGPDWWVKIADFGISKRAQAGDSTLRTQVYTPNYVAPEVLLSDNYTRAVDIWSIGIITFLLLTGHDTVFKKLELYQYSQKSIDLPIDRLQDCGVSELGRDFVALLLSSDPRDRPLAEACLRHEWTTVEPYVLQPEGPLSDEFNYNLTTSLNSDKSSARWTTIRDNSTEETSFNKAEQLTGPMLEKASKRTDSPSRHALHAHSIPEISPTLRFNQRTSFAPRDRQDTLKISTADEATRPRAERDQRSSSYNGHPKYRDTDVRNNGSIRDESHENAAIGPAAVTDWSSSPLPIALYWKRKKKLSGHSGHVIAVTFSPDGRLIATASDDRTARLWDVATGVEMRQLTGHSDGVIAVLFSPDGRLLATASWDNTARLWDVATGVEMRQLQGHSSSVYAVTFSPDGRLIATASDDRTARLWNVATGVEMRQLQGHSRSVYAVTFSPDGRLLATASLDRTARLWDMATGVEMQQLKGHSSEVYAVTFSPDGQLIATASEDTTARLWDVATGVEVRQLTGHSDRVSAVTFSPDGRLLATALDDKTARLWDVATGVEVRQLTGHSNIVSAMTFSPDGRLVATAALDRTARLWEVPTVNPHVGRDKSSLDKSGLGHKTRGIFQRTP